MLSRFAGMGIGREEEVGEVILRVGNGEEKGNVQEQDRRPGRGPPRTEEEGDGFRGGRMKIGR
jgi:hypothetical protein